MSASRTTRIPAGFRNAFPRGRRRTGSPGVRAACAMSNFPFGSASASAYPTIVLRMPCSPFPGVVCMHICTYLSLYTCIYTLTSLYACIYALTSLYTCIYALACRCMRAYVHSPLVICTYLRPGLVL
ncbi:hypothetical protein C8Q70DRAFT_940016 [Cubamyces menziesii]|nr:hypothetical protein C8Q70DRAFT_940016 [Cubamyces menziesii]